MERIHGIIIGFLAGGLFVSGIIGLAQLAR